MPESHDERIGALLLKTFPPSWSKSLRLALVPHVWSINYRLRKSRAYEGLSPSPLYCTVVVLQEMLYFDASVLH